MSTETHTIELNSKGRTDIIDITKKVSDLAGRSTIDSGIVTVFCPGSTGSITTIEYEPGLVKDIKDFLEKFFPYEYDYAHHGTWHDDNGSAHVRAALMGPSLSIPVINNELTLGTWQQIVFIDFDTRPRKRKLVIQLTG